MKSEVYSQKGKKVGQVTLKKEFFDVPVKPDFLHQVVKYYESLSREKIAKTKDRSEKRGGGRKPWRQKGTGRARHGSIRSPLWKGGGVTFGPSLEKKYETKLNKKATSKALFGVLSKKFKDGEIIFLDKIEIKKPKTKEVANILKGFSKVKKDIQEKKVIFILKKRNESFSKAVGNIGNILTIPSDSLNPYFLLRGKYLVIEKDALSNIQKSEAPKSTRKKEVKKKPKPKKQKSDKNK